MAAPSDAGRVFMALTLFRRALGAEVPIGSGDETVSLSQLAALQALAEREHTAGQLARTLRSTLPNLSQLVDGLVERGWVLRHPDPDDRRKVWLAVTEVGRSAYEQAAREIEERIEPMLSDLRPAERRALLVGLEALSGALTWATPSGAAPSRVPVGAAREQRR